MQCQGKVIRLLLFDEIMKTATASERRQQPRVKSNWPVALTLPEGQVTGVVENISPSGAFISVKGSPQLEGNFRMVIKPPNRQALSATVRVIWTKIFTPHEVESCLGVGVKFVDMSQGDSQFLHDLVASFYIV